jgi:hypothetical protein
VWDRQAATGASTFSMDDLADLPALVAKFRVKQRVAEYLESQLREETRALLADYGGGRDQELKEALVRDLNAIILGPSLYDEKRFSEIRLREETQELLRRDPQGPELQRLNRLLLEDTFPRELAGRPELE